MFQNYALFPNMTVRENIELVISDRKKRRAMTESLLEAFRLIGLKDRYPHQLSGGEQQRIALARIIAYEPVVLMLDEPFSAMDTYLKEELYQELAEIVRDFNGDVLMVSHSKDELYRFCDSIAVVNNGQIIEYGKKSMIFANPVTITAAKLTGCRNISRAGKISDHRVLAYDWNIALNTDSYVDNDIGYVGIHAHNIRRSVGNYQENVINADISAVYEGPNEYTVNLNTGTMTNEAAKLWWVLAKQEWSKIYREQLTENILIPKEHILLLK